MGKIIQPTRRGFIGGLAALVAAPAIVRAASLMPVKPVKFSMAGITEYDGPQATWTLDIQYGQLQPGALIFLYGGAPGGLFVVTEVERGDTKISIARPQIIPPLA